MDYQAWWSANLSVFPVKIEGGNTYPPSGHQKYANNIPSKADQTRWLMDLNGGDAPQAYGMACGKSYDSTHRIVCLDVDLDELAPALSYLFPTPCARFGSKGIGLFYKVERDDASMKKTHRFKLSGKPVVEFLSMGSFTYVPPSIHRRTGNRYVWRGQALPDALDNLPLLTPKDLRLIEAIVNYESDGSSLENVIYAEGTHQALLGLSALLVSKGVEAERAIRFMELLLPRDYSGDERGKIPEMVESAFRKGFDKPRIAPGEDMTDEDFAEVFSDWHYITAIHRMANALTKEVLNPDQFNAVFANRVRRAFSVFIQWSDRSVKNSLTYLPGNPPLVEDRMNMWRPSELNPKAGDVSPWLNHIKRFYREDEVEHLLNWMAHALQKPDVKPGHAILMGSNHEGVGKDLWLLPIRAAFGRHNVSEIGADSLSSAFNEWLAHKHLVIVQEIWSGSRRELSNQLKPLLSSPPDVVMVNEKGVPRYSIPNVCATIMLTNHKDAVSMAKEDRRYFVMWTDDKPESPRYYREFVEWVTDVENQGRVYDYLLRRDISDFSIKSPPPRTLAKDDMVDATMTRGENLVVVVRDIFADMGLKDVVAESALYDQLRESAPDVAKDVMRVPRSSPRYPIRLALKQLGYEPLPIKAVKKVQGRVHQITVHCIADKHAQYVVMRPVDLYDMVQHPVEY